MCSTKMLLKSFVDSNNPWTILVCCSKPDSTNREVFTKVAVFMYTLDVTVPALISKKWILGAIYLKNNKMIWCKLLFTFEEVLNVRALTTHETSLISVKIQVHTLIQLLRSIVFWKVFSRTFCDTHKKSCKYLQWIFILPPLIFFFKWTSFWGICPQVKEKYIKKRKRVAESFF